MKRLQGKVATPLDSLAERAYDMYCTTRNFSEAARACGRSSTWARKTVRRYYHEIVMGEMPEAQYIPRKRVEKAILQNLIRQLPKDNWDTIDGIRSDIFNRTLLERSQSSVRKYLKHEKVTRKGKTIVPVGRVAERNVRAQEECRLDLLTLDPRTVLFMDEAGADKKNAKTNRGYAPAGKPAVRYAASANDKGKRVSCIGIINYNGFVYYELTNKTNNSEAVIDFMWHAIPKMLAVGAKYLVLDNVRIHCATCCAMLMGAGITPILLPVYSPQLNPIEQSWKAAKNAMKHIAGGGDMKHLWEQAIARVPVEQFVSYINHSCAVLDQTGHRVL
eukprot:TRINITY_DN3934_c0_g1_i2.p1 TRINITY_DN3934_c0_g1~~TRINITY_DN3934_c0_g1_i2.p1  ORF type:complete len:332 (+),score=48.23 TRINITY_DN3934_c0_g1_i2:67-1062(+)